MTDKFTSPQRRLLNESGDLASWQQKEQSLLQNLEQITDKNSQSYRLVYNAWAKVSAEVKALQQQPQGQEEPTSHERAEARYNRDRQGALATDLAAIEKVKAARAGSR